MIWTIDHAAGASVRLVRNSDLDWVRSERPLSGRQLSLVEHRYRPQGGDSDKNFAWAVLMPLTHFS
jgi:hypothetical protein